LIHFYKRDISDISTKNFEGKGFQKWIYRPTILAA